MKKLYVIVNNIAHLHNNNLVHFGKLILTYYYFIIV